jgi:hypothetical protein
MVKSQVGINTVEQIVNTIPANVDFTMITYSDGKFLSEILAKQSSDIENVGRLLGQKFTTADVKILSRDTRNVKGIQYHQALINGSLDQKEATSAIKPVQQPRFLTAEQFQQRIKAICQESGLTIKQFDVGAEKSEATLSIQPIKFRAFGLKANATNLLRQILEENLNVSLSKISLIANDVDVSNPYNTLVINIGLFKE